MRSMLKENPAMQMKWKRTPNYSSSRCYVSKKKIKAQKASQYYKYLSERIKF